MKAHHSRAIAQKPARFEKMGEGRFASVRLVKKFILEQVTLKKYRFTLDSVCKEHRDIFDNKTASRVEQLESYERQTKTRTGSDKSDVRAYQ